MSFFHSGNTIFLFIFIYSNIYNMYIYRYLIAKPSQEEKRMPEDYE